MVNLQVKDDPSNSVTRSANADGPKPESVSTDKSAHLATPVRNAREAWSPMSVIAPSTVLFGFFFVWYLVCRYHLVPDYDLPSPAAAWLAGVGEIKAGRLPNDIVASLFRVVTAFTISSVLGIPCGLWLGQHTAARRAFVPMLNFFRSISPLSWIPFAILWFHIGDKPAIFLIFMSTFFPIALATMAAVANIPAIYFRVARDYHYSGWELLSKVTFPAVLPQIITSLRVAFGIAWVVIVAAEMVGCQDGLGYGIWDARNGLRSDIMVAYMVIIGILGMAFDRALAQLSKLPNVRWGYER